ncbi:MAG: hypothetical protein GY775_06270 [Candidatus Scalindua sp.]|jgi:hypothetical protein|nr:hypothetical protein [Gammaproteobacteria bacterium]MCP4253003.1 hypothetical protein [Candidatus Scalindua sp.]
MYNTKTKNETVEAIQEATAEITTAIENLRNGDYYGDTLPDAIADIAKSLRILSGREQLK